MNKDALITEADVDRLDSDILTQHFAETVRDFVEGEPNLSYVMGLRLGILSDALQQAGIGEKERESIIASVHMTLGINMYLMRKATRRLIDDLMPSEETDGAS